MNKSHREIYDWDPKSPWKYRSQTEAKSPFDIRAINEIKWYLFDKKRAHTGKKKAALFRDEQARWTMVRHSDGFRSVESKRISPSTPSSLGWYWRRAYHMSLFCSSYLMKDELARNARNAILFQSYMVIMRFSLCMASP